MARPSPKAGASGRRVPSWAAPLAALLLGVGAPFAGAGAGCPELSYARPAGTAPPSVVLVLADTVRRDQVGTYGGAARTPELDAFAERNLVFEQASSQAPWTKPSVATLFTSLYPSQHQVASDPQLTAFGRDRPDHLVEADVLSDGFDTLAEVLREAGLRTAAVVPNPWLDRRYGYGQGFERYEDGLASWNAAGEEVTRAALAWLEGVPPGTPYFLYVHYMDAHRPYGRLSYEEALEASQTDPGDRYLRPQDLHFAATGMRLRDGRTLREAGIVPNPVLFDRAYARGIESFDRALGQLLRGLEARPGFDDTIVIVTSDHGEGLFEHGYGNHGAGLYESEAAVPLVVRLPGARPARGRLACLVGLVDLMPTLCDAVGATCPSDAAGRSLARKGSEPGAPSYLVTEGIMTRPANRAIRDREYKLFYEPQGRRDERDDLGPWSFYALDATPLERRNLMTELSSSPELAERFRRMRRALADAVPDFVAPASGRAPVDDAMRERLRVLGYTEN